MSYYKVVIFSNFYSEKSINNKKDKDLKPCLYHYTSSRGRTGTMLPSLDFESSASANSAMLAYVYDNTHKILCQFDKKEGYSKN